MLADTLGRPLRFCITPGQASDIITAPDLLEGQEADAVLADKAYDSNDPIVPVAVGCTNGSLRTRGW